MSIKGLCPVCETSLQIKEDTEISELMFCPECQTLLVVEDIQETEAQLGQAPVIEEDWGQ